MGDRARRLLDDALQLPLDERAEIAAELLASMDGTSDTDVEAAWAAELELRARGAVSGERRGSDWLEVRARIVGSTRR